MKIKKISIILSSLLFFSFFILLYLVNYRWGGGDAQSYFAFSKDSDGQVFADSYSLSGFLLSPFVLLSGFNPDSLIWASLLFRFFFIYCARGGSYLIPRVSFVGALLFPFHSILSLFPGKDIFSFGFFILLVFSVAGKKPFWAWCLFSFAAFWFRPFLGLFLMMFCFCYLIESRVVSRFSLSRNASLIFSVVFVLTCSVFVAPFVGGYGGMSDVLERVAIDVNQGYFNLQGYTSFPLNILNIFYPLLSSNPLSLYSLLGLENLLSLYFISRFVFSKGVGVEWRPFKMLCIFSLCYAVAFSTLWPNITDAARKIYPLAFCGASCYVIGFSKVRAKGLNVDLG